MTKQTNYNPDVLTCLANLSNDEVFTPPVVVNQMLDLLPVELWSNPDTTFLDPVSKSGVFLREMAKRLNKGLERMIPDKQQRINHILTKQLFGIAITELTSLLSRRSVYCSKTANGRYSICDRFVDEQGNVRFDRTEHTWIAGKCKYCGANQEVYDRGAELETHAYQFIHTDKPNEIFKNMKFDVIIGNPPYQLNDGGGTGSSAMPIYHKFIQQAKKLNPRYLSMVVPSRWFSGGRGLDEFRDEMLNDNRIRVIHDFLDASDCFPGVEIKGGVCYFLWDRDNRGNCNIFTHSGDRVSESNRPLLEKGAETFIRYNEAISILHKIQKLKEDSFASLISANDPFGFDIRVENSYKRVKPIFKLKPFKEGVEFYYNGWRKEGLGYIDKLQITKNIDWIGKHKVLIPKAWGTGSLGKDWINPFICNPNSCCTETYLLIGPFNNIQTAENVIGYTQTRFFHFMLSMIKITQNAMRKVYQFVPMQDFSESWTDEKLYAKYGLTEDEIAFIDSIIRSIE